MKHIIKPKLLNNKVIFDNKYMTVKTDHIKMKMEENNNVKELEKDYYLVDCPDCVACVVCDNGKFLFVNQYRYPAQDFVTELVAGMVDKGFEPWQAIIKELKEEAGIVANKVIFLGSIMQCPGLLSNKMHIFCCNDFSKEEKELEDFEKFVNLTSGWIEEDKLIDMIKTNKIKDATTLAALNMYFSNSELHK